MTSSPERMVGRGSPPGVPRESQSSCSYQRNLGNGADASASITTGSLRFHGLFRPARRGRLGPRLPLGVGYVLLGLRLHRPVGIFEAQALESDIVGLDDDPHRAAVLQA